MPNAGEIKARKGEVEQSILNWTRIQINEYIHEYLNAYEYEFEPLNLNWGLIFIVCVLLEKKNLFSFLELDPIEWSPPVPPSPFPVPPSPFPFYLTPLSLEVVVFIAGRSRGHFCWLNLLTLVAVVVAVSFIVVTLVGVFVVVGLLFFGFYYI